MRILRCHTRRMRTAQLYTFSQPSSIYLSSLYTLEIVPRLCTAQHRTHSLSPVTKLGLSFSKRLSETILLLFLSD